MNMKVLILDAQNQNSLAIVRHLGRKGYVVHVCGNKKNTLSFYSKYAQKKIILPDPKKEPQKFIDSLIVVIKNEKYDLLMPVGFKSYQICAEYQDAIRNHTQLIVTSFPNIRLASDKTQTNLLAERLSIPYPKTYSVSKESDLDTLNVSFPLVIKSPFESGKNVVEYAHNIQDAKRRFSRMKVSLNDSNPLIQQYIDGDGYGFFAYYEDGECKKYFMHHRIREYPVTGGASVCAESFADPILLEYGLKILNELKWNGIAMVEFKQRRATGEYYLMEINPKFWGSLELAIAAGIDFPEYMLMKCRGEVIPSGNKYDKLTFQWLINGELFHFFERPSSFFAILKTLFISKKDLQFSDLKPNLFQFVNIFVSYYKKIVNK